MFVIFGWTAKYSVAEEVDAIWDKLDGQEVMKHMDIRSPSTRRRPVQYRVKFDHARCKSLPE